MALSQNNIFQKFSNNYDKFKERLLNNKSEKILIDYQTILSEISNKEKKLNECFCKECLDDYINSSFKLLSQEMSDLTLNSSLINLKYFTCKRVVLVLKRHKIQDEKLNNLKLEKYESEIQVIGTTKKKDLKIFYEKENLLDLLNLRQDTSKSIKIISWSIFGLFSSIAFIALIFFYKKKYMKI